MNFLSGTVERTGEACFVQVQDQRWALAGPRFAGLQAGQAVKLAIRPNYLKVASADDEAGSLRLRGKVELIELLGAEALVTFEFAGERLAALVPASDLPELNSVVTFQFKTADLHVFDAQTEQNVSLPVPQGGRTTLASPPHEDAGVQGAALH
jgi:multiple sugar transport system ATP-binding protein